MGLFGIFKRRKKKTYNLYEYKEQLFDVLENVYSYMDICKGHSETKLDITLSTDNEILSYDIYYSYGYIDITVSSSKWYKAVLNYIAKHFASANGGFTYRMSVGHCKNTEFNAERMIMPQLKKYLREFEQRHKIEFVYKQNGAEYHL